MSDIKKKVVVTKKAEITINAEGIIHLLKECNYLPKDAYNISTTFDIPGGGDYSNTSISIDDDSPVRVIFETREDL